MSRKHSSYQIFSSSAPDMADYSSFSCKLAIVAADEFNCSAKCKIPPCSHRMLLANKDFPPRAIYACHSNQRALCLLACSCNWKRARLKGIFGFGQYTPAVVLSLHNESIWHENESRRKKKLERFTMVHNYPFHNLRVNTQPITFYARFFLGGQTVAGNCEISNIPTFSSSMAAVKATNYTCLIWYTSDKRVN